MLPARNRLRLLPYYNENFKGQKVLGDDFILIYQRNQPVFKAACVVTKKIAPRAVDRNRIRRLINQSLANQTGRGLKIVVIVKKNIAFLKAVEVNRRLEKLFNKIR